VLGCCQAKIIYCDDKVDVCVEKKKTGVPMPPEKGAELQKNEKLEGKLTFSRTGFHFGDRRLQPKNICRFAINNTPCGFMMFFYKLLTAS
jgi:hypothetical protein